MNKFNKVKHELRERPRKWLVTGCAGFIGSNIIEELLGLGQEVVGVDNFSTGYRDNLTQVRQIVGEDAWRAFTFYEGDIRDYDLCLKASDGVDYVLHQAALGSVPRSIELPLLSHDSNVNGFLNVLNSSRVNNVKRIVYASSSSVYGDNPDLPKVESVVGRPLSPYALTKKINELYSEVFSRVYRTEAIGIRYFNVFGKRQDPCGPYAAVIPKWINAIQNDEDVLIFGDGSTSRDFCYIKNTVQMNILIALSDYKFENGEVFNCACGDKTSLLDLFELLRSEVSKNRGMLTEIKAPRFEDFRKGDIAHSQASIEKARELLMYIPTHNINEGIAETVSWYLKGVI